jgi:AraC-like DNA-binding protein
MENVADNPNADAYYFFKKPALNQLFEVILTSKTDLQIISAIENFVRQHIKTEKADNRLLMATELIGQKEIYNVDKVASKINVSSVTLRNLFRQKVGLSPKEFIRLNRIRKALNHTNTENLTSLAYELGYFDQSHFIHEFKSCFGLTPKQYYSNKALAFDFYNFGRWNGDSFGISNK